MEKVYLPTTYSLAEIQNNIKEMAQAGIDMDHTVIEDSFEDFLKTLQPEDTVMVYSFDCFASLIDMLSAITRIPIRSFREAWILEPVADNQKYLEQIYELGKKIHTARTNRGLDRAKREGKKLGRAYGSFKPEQQNRELILKVDMIRREKNVTIAQACQMVGCSTYTYHANKRRLLAQH